MKKLNLKAVAAAMAAVLTLGVAGCSSQSTSSTASSDNGSAVSTEDQSLKKVKDAGKLILGLDATFKPMGYTDENNEIVGFDIDVAEEVCKRLGVELVKQPIN